MPPQTTFVTLKEQRDIWKLLWKVVIAVNAVPAVIFLVLIVLQLIGVNEANVGSIALVSSLTLTPLLVLFDLVFAAVYFLVKRPSKQELLKRFEWLGGVFVVAFAISAIYAGLASADISF